MQLIEILESKENLFLVDDIEDKKTKSLVNEINEQLKSILDKLETFYSFANSQLEGEYHNKLVMVKSLKNYYGSWAAVNNAYANIEKEEANEINKFYNEKNQLINNLNILLKDSQKLPVISAFDVIGEDFYLPKKDHSVIILGGHNNFVIETIIKELEENLVVKGNFDKVEAKELIANYVQVDKNVKICNEGINDLTYSKASKMDKLAELVEQMEETGRNLVFFETYKENLKSIGCTVKEIDLFEKEIFKKYVPLKKQLQKTLKVTFENISEVVVDEKEYSDDEFSKEFDNEYVEKTINKEPNLDPFEDDE